MIMSTTRTSRSSHFIRSGFTLVELMFVVVIMSIVSVSVIPAMNNVAQMRAGAARDDLVRMIEVSKGLAVASGVPHGVQVDLVSSTIEMVEITDQGRIQTLRDPLTNESRSIVLPVVYSGITLISMVNGDGGGGSGVIWFDFESTPHTRTNDGAFDAVNTLVATITLSSGEQVRIHPHSGLVEVQ